MRGMASEHGCSSDAEKQSEGESEVTNCKFKSRS
jgi:hypothetical protein